MDSNKQSGNCELDFSNSLSIQEMDTLASSSTSMKFFKKNSVLWSQGSSSLDCYQVCCGVIRYTRIAENGKKRILGFFGPGDFIGLDGVLSHRDRQHTAECVSDSQLIWHERHQFLQLLKNDTIFLQSVVNQLSSRCLELTIGLEYAVFYSVTERLIWELFRLAAKFGRLEHEEIIIDTELLKSDFELLVGACHSTVTQARIGLEKRGLLKFSNRWIRIKDPCKLAKLVSLSSADLTTLVQFLKSLHSK